MHRLPASSTVILRSLLFTAIAAISFSTVGAATIDHDNVQPFAQPEPVTMSEKAAVKFKPSLQIIDGCHPYPAVNAAGDTNGGLKGSGKIDGDCKGSGLGSQVYGRAGWYKDLWAIMYAWYLPKDKGYGGIFAKGQRHKWVNAVVWLDNPAIENPKVLAVSTWNWGGGYLILKDAPPACNSRICNPRFDQYFNGASVMVSYEPYNYPYEYSYHTLRPTAARGTGELQDLIMWEQLTEEARAALSETDFGDKVDVPFIDANFNAALEMTRPFL